MFRTVFFSALTFLSVLTVHGQDTTETFIISCECRLIEPTSEPASFPGGPDSLRAFIERTIVYPEDAYKNKVEGIVHVQFEIKKSGKVGAIYIVQSVSPSLDNEVLRVISKMPIWIPAEQMGKLVNTSFVMPIQFILKK